MQVWFDYESNKECILKEKPALGHYDCVDKQLYIKVQKTLRLNVWQGADASPAHWTHVVPREHSNLACVHGGALEPAILTAFQHQKHFSFPQLQLILLTRRVREHCHIAKQNKHDGFKLKARFYYCKSSLHSSTRTGCKGSQAGASAGVFSAWFQCCQEGGTENWTFALAEPDDGRRTGWRGSNAYQVCMGDLWV